MLRWTLLKTYESPWYGNGDEDQGSSYRGIHPAKRTNHRPRERHVHLEVRKRPDEMDEMKVWRGRLARGS